MEFRGVYKGTGHLEESGGIENGEDGIKMFYN
jgi:hypothetical protein